jgi:hypothetical protein
MSQNTRTVLIVAAVVIPVVVFVWLTDDFFDDVATIWNYLF